MTDVVALVSVFVTGVASSFGPCVAPRYLVLAAYAGQRKRTLAFVGGCLAGYLIYAFAGVVIALLRLGTHVAYGLLAIALIVSGARILTKTTVCEAWYRSAGSWGTAFLAGVASSAIFSPCCTPIALALGLAAPEHGGAMAASLLLSFGLGHSLPLIVAALASFSKMRRFSVSRDITTTVSGSLLLSVGGLYAILA